MKLQSLPGPPFRMTARDELIMQTVARFRLLTSPHLATILGGSARGIHNRLRILTDHKYFIRLPGHITEPIAYGIATRGAIYLAKHGFPINHRLDWTAKNDRSNIFRTHTLKIAETMFHFDRAV